MIRLYSKLAHPSNCARNDLTLFQIDTSTKLCHEMIWLYSKLAHPPNCARNYLTLFQIGTSTKLCHEIIWLYSKLAYPPNCATNCATLFQINTLTILCQEWSDIVPNWHTHQPLSEAIWVHSKLTPSHVISLDKLISSSTCLRLISSSPCIVEIWGSTPDIYCTVTNPV